MRFVRWNCLAVASVLACTPAGAGVNRWTPIGPDRGGYCFVSTAPSNDSFLYAGSTLLFRSIDAGSTWDSPEGTPPYWSCLVTVDVADPLRLYAVRYPGLFRS